jgi:deoxyadenosine/deoxycytidine kinase
MSDFTIDYSSGDRILAVKPVDELFEVLYASIADEKICQLKLERLVKDATLVYEKSLIKSDTDAESSRASSNNNNDSESSSSVFTTPVKSKKPTSAPVTMPSPCSISDCDVLESPTSKLYSHKFVDILATTFFESVSSPSTPELAEPHQPILLSIEGNIGAGKSTLLRALRTAHPEWTFIDEPLDTWTALKNEKGNLLECFYGDQDRWAYTFQNCSILSRFQLIENAIKDNKDKYHGKHVYVTERSLGTDYHVFSKMLKEDGMLDEMEFDLYERWLSELEKTCTPLSGIVLVDTPPLVCSERIKKRSREGEDGIPLAYLEHLDTFQRRWLDNIDIPCEKTCTQEGIESCVEFMLSR